MSAAANAVLALLEEADEATLARVAELLAPYLPSANGSGADSGWLRGAAAIAEHIGAPPSRVYALAETSPPRIPVQRDGSRLVARRDELDRWLLNGGGKRP